MHEKVGVKQHWLTPHSRKWGVSWPPWPRASAVYDGDVRVVVSGKPRSVSWKSMSGAMTRQ